MARGSNPMLDNRSGRGMGSSSLGCDRRHSGAVRSTRKVSGRGNAQDGGSKGRTTAPGERKAAPPARALEEATAEAASSAPTPRHGAFPWGSASLRPSWPSLPRWRQKAKPHVVGVNEPTSTPQPETALPAQAALPRDTHHTTGQLRGPSRSHSLAAAVTRSSFASPGYCLFVSL